MGFISQTTNAVGAPDLVLPDVPCDLLVEIGNWVVMSNNIAIRANAIDMSQSNVLGLVESRSAPDLVNIRVLGVSAPIFSGLDETKEYYLSSEILGGMGVSAPMGTGSVVLRLGQPFNATQFLVFKGIRMVRS